MQGFVSRLTKFERILHGLEKDDEKIFEVVSKMQSFGDQWISDLEKELCHMEEAGLDVKKLIRNKEGGMEVLIILQHPVLTYLLILLGLIPDTVPVEIKHS